MSSSSFVSRFFQNPAQSFFLFGPRGTGKSTFIRNKYPNALWIDFLRPDILRSYLAYPERLYDVILGHSKDPIVVIDEVQKAPSLLPIVHDIIEQKKGLQFVLTGSSARKLKRAHSDLLAGRALMCTLHPFMATELGERFSFNQALQFGLLPLLLGTENPEAVLQAYVSLYIQEEIHAEGLIRNLEGFSRFLEAISFSHGSLLNTTNVSRECGVKRKTVDNYISILEELLLSFQVPIFSNRAQRELVSHSKIYLFDVGVFRALRPQGLLDKVEEIEGMALEGLIAQHLKAWVDYTKQSHTLSFWRTRSGVEVDFVVYGPKGFWALEVKNSKRVHSHDTKSLEIFLQDYPQAKAILLYRGTERLQIGNVLCIPCEDFLLQLKPDQDLLHSL